MLRSPNKQDGIHYGSAPNISLNNDNVTAVADNITQSLKRKRCNCGGEYSENSKIDKFISTITMWQQESDEKLSDIKTFMQDLMRQNSEILLSQNETEKSIEVLTLKYEDLIQQLGAQQSQSQVFIERVSKIELSTEELDRRSRSGSLELRNINLPNKAPSKDDLLTVVTRIFKELTVEVSMTDIFDVRKLPSRADSVSIVCTLNSVFLKTKVLRAFKDYNKSFPSSKLNSTIIGGTQHPIYIAEHLTAHARRLFYLAREYAKAENYKYCWTSDGRVLLRKADGSKPIVVTSEGQLSGPQSLN